MTGGSEKPDAKTGDVRTRRGGITARQVNTGLSIDGPMSDANVHDALMTLSRLTTGNVEAARSVTADMINVGVIIHQEPTRDANEFLDRLRLIQQILVDDSTVGSQPPEMVHAMAVIDDILAQDQLPLADTLEIHTRIGAVMRVLTRAGGAIQTGSALAGAVASALEKSIELYRTLTPRS